jgi:Ni/Fe-hydrogenase 1 B-type cytochrome subunit
MALIAPIKHQPGQPSVNKKNSAALRLWHWLNAIAISGLLITVLINSTVLKPRKSAPLVLAEIQKDNPAFTLDQARTAVGFLEDKVWEWHVYFGFALTALLLLRIITEFFGLAERKFINQLKKAWQQFKTTKQNRQDAQHELVVKGIYIVFYILLVIMVATGLSLAFQDSLPFSKALQHSIKEVHGFCMYLILGFTIVHLAGVVLAERKAESKGIVSDMINGG